MLTPDVKRQDLLDMPHEELAEFAFKMTQMARQLEENNRLNQARRFGPSSEKTTIIQDRLFNEMEEVVDSASVEELEEPEIQTKKKAKKTSKTKRTMDLSKLPSKTIHIDIEDKICPSCGDKLSELQPTTMQFLVKIPAKYQLIKYIIHHYTCKHCNEQKDRMQVIEPEGRPIRLIEGSIATSSIVASLAYEKFVMGTPLYRQEKDLQKKHIPLPRQNMSNWMMRCSEDYLRFVYEAMHEDLKKQEVLHMDETPIPVIEDKKEGRQKDYEWLAMSGAQEEKQMALYFFKKTRQYDNVEDILGKENQSIIHSDGYGAYHKGIGKMSVGCMAHLRRKFEEAMKSSPSYQKMKELKDATQQKDFLKQNEGYANILRTIKMINELFKIESKLKEQEANIEKIYKVRQEESRSLFDELFVWLQQLQPQYAPSGKMGKAIAYAFHEKEYLENYLKDGRCEISNNRAEREGIKPFVIARKNFLFSNTKSGAQSSSIYFSLIISARMNQLDEEKYLSYVLDTLSQKGLTEQNIQAVLPYSKQLPKELYIK